MHILARLRGKLRASAGLRTMSGLLGAGLAALALTTPAHAVPSYARQTGAECAACHVGGYGPQLTPYGIKFKINGYTDTDGGSGKVPLSAMAVVNFTHTAKDAAAGDKVDHFSTNNNGALQEASLFLAGRLTDNIGTFIQATYSGVDKISALDQVDVRYARQLQLGGKDATVGLSVNSNPTLSDPFNTLGQWRFPYTASDFNTGYGPSPMVENLASGVAGANAYLFYDNSLYAEAGLYKNLGRHALDAINADDPGKINGMSTYWRLAYFKDRKRDNFSVGLFGFDTSLQPDRIADGLYDKYRDLGIDASYQFLGNRQHVFTVNASYVREWQQLDHSGAGEHNTLSQTRVAGSYHYNQTWGGTLGLFDTRGNVSAQYGDSLNGKPNSSGYILQADWTPWGKEGSWAAPWANVRLGIQYTGYNRYMGGSTYLDGSGNPRHASDNNTTMLFLWTSI